MVGGRERVMAELFNITHEDGTVDEWDAIALNGTATLATATAAALAGTNYGISCFVNGASDNCAAQLDFTHSTTTIRYRYYLDPNSITMGDTEECGLGGLESAADSKQHIRVFLGYTTVNGYHLFASLRDDADSWTDTADILITDAPHLIEIHATKASTALLSDATLILYIDSQLKGTVTGVDLFDDWGFDQLNAGLTGGVDAGTSGTVYIDEIKGNDDGSVIGGILNVVELNAASSGWVANLSTTALAGTEQIKAPPGAGKNLYLEEVSIIGNAAANVTIGSGETEAEGDELIANGDMELGGFWSNWSDSSTNEQSSSPTHGGTYSRHFVPTSTDDGIQSAQFTTTTNKWYKTDLWIYPPSTNCRIYISNGIDTAWISTPSFAGLTANTWNHIVHFHQESAGGDGASMLVVSHTDTSGSFYVDDVSIKEATASVATALIGPIEMTTSGRPYKIRFPRPIKVDTNAALTIDTDGVADVQVQVTGFTK